MLHRSSQRRLVDAKRAVQLLTYLLEAIGGDEFGYEEYEQWVGEIADLSARYSKGKTDEVPP